MTAVSYRGWRDAGGVHVRVIDDERQSALPRRLDLANHSPTGFEFGYGGSGPAQLALAILAHALDDDERAVRLHQIFKRRVVALFPKDGWQLTREEVIAHAENCEKDTGRRQLLPPI